MLRASSMCSILLLLLHDSSNFKIRIQAASALAVPASILDYGESFPNVIQGLVHILENQGSDRIASPSNFKYRVALENQLTSTVLHVPILTSSSDHEPVKDFLVKKASFLEDWFKALCLLLGETISSQGELEDNKSIRNPKKEIGTLIQLYNSRKHHAIEQKFEKLANSSEFSVDLHIPAVHTNPVIKFLAQPHAVPEKCCHLKATFSRGHGISEMHWQHTEDS